MYNYAKVVDGVVKSTQSSTNEIWSRSLIEIFDNVVKIGDIYADGVFTTPEPVVEPPAPVRIITVKAFRQRLSPAVRKNLRESTIDAVADMREDLESAAYVDLDDDDVADGLGGFGPRGLGWMTADEVAAQLADGTPKEQYNGVL